MLCFLFLYTEYPFYYLLLSDFAFVDKKSIILYSSIHKKSIVSYQDYYGLTFRISIASASFGQKQRDWTRMRPVSVCKSHMKKMGISAVVVELS